MDTMSDSLFIDYYKRPFWELHKQLSERIGMRQLYLHERGLFWNQVSFGLYDYDSAIPLLKKYSVQIENRIKQIVEQKSFLYWIHVYRRIAPEEPVPDCTELDIVRTRAIMEIAFQKYGRAGFCDHIDRTKRVSVDKIMNGILMKPEYELERSAVQKSKDSLVLTSFGVDELSEVYELEKLCYEMNLINKAIRLLGKGCVIDYSEKRKWHNLVCDDDTIALMESYDNRITMNGITSSYLGVYFSKETQNTLGYCLFPAYNCGKYTFSYYKDLIRDLYKDDLVSIGNNKPNFVIYVFDLLNYYKTHKDASNSFFETNSVSFEAIVIVIRYLYYEIFSKTDIVEGFINLVYRGYKLFKKKELVKTLNSIKGQLSSEFGIRSDSVKNSEITKALAYLTYKKNKQDLLDLHYCSLYYPLCEFDDFYLVDLIWMYRLFLTLFFRIKMEDQNFKGIILENSLKKIKSALPTTRLRAKDGSERQIDYSFIKNDTLYVLECKAVSMSIAFESGDKRAVEYRTKEVVNRSLMEVDEKIDWLLSHKDILHDYTSSVVRIVGIGVSAFVEYIPSKDKKYWLNDQIPRVLLPKEIEYIRENDIEVIYNVRILK